ncbi:MAG TPA: TetR/AcrR family transcriptional regulator [Vicinamibacteria bacterium]|nr:TetR/AcrR family transcriptional regulator [Vicinamibacteria bacterium]
MQSNLKSIGQRRPSFIEEKRRNQIVEIAIQTIATQGFSQASLAEIAKKAGISKGVISYHFDGKEELVEEILRSLLRKPADFIKERVSRAQSAVEKLRAYVEANFEFMKMNRVGYVALVDLWGQRDSGRNSLNADAYEPSRHYLAHILEEGQRTGEMRAFPVMPTASLIQGAVDGIMLQWVLDEKAIDLDVAKEEVVSMVLRHVQGDEQ